MVRFVNSRTIFEYFEHFRQAVSNLKANRHLVQKIVG
jgi:hypothetical protein